MRDFNILTGNSAGVVETRLAPEEWDFAVAIAEEITRRDAEAGKKDLLVATWRDPIKNMALGYGAEIVVADLLGVPINTNTDPTKISKHDLVYRTWRIDVKNPRHQAMHVPRWKNKRKCDIYFACSGGPVVYQLQGWLPSFEAQAPEYWNESVLVPCWQIPFGDLFSYFSLVGPIADRIMQGEFSSRAGT